MDLSYEAIRFGSLLTRLLHKVGQKNSVHFLSVKSFSFLLGFNNFLLIKWYSTSAHHCFENWLVFKTWISEKQQCIMSKGGVWWMLLGWVLGHVLIKFLISDLKKSIKSMLMRFTYLIGRCLTLQTPERSLEWEGGKIACPWSGKYSVIRKVFLKNQVQKWNLNSAGFSSRGGGLVGFLIRNGRLF